MEDPVFYVALEPGKPHRTELEKNIARLVRLEQQARQLQKSMDRFNHCGPLLHVPTDALKRQQYVLVQARKTLMQILRHEKIIARSKKSTRA